MAITNIAYPSGSPTVQDSLWHVFSSNMTASTDFKYVVDVYTNSILQVRVKLFPEPTTTKGYFDAGTIVRNTMTYEWLTPKDQILMCEPSVSGEIAQSYNYQIGEEYSGTTYLNLASGTIKAYNWVAPTFKRKVTDLSAYNGMMLSNRSQTINTSLGESLYVGAKDVSGLTIATYDVNNTLITSVAISLGGTKEFAQLNIGSKAINASSAIITSSVKYYTVTIGTTVLTVNLICDNKYDSYDLHFMNHLGMFDTARFGLASKLTMDVARKGFEKKDYSLGASSVSYYDANNKYLSGKVNYQNKKDHTYKLTMDAPTDADYQWLNELIDSPQVYLENDGYFYPVSLKSNNYEYGKYVNNRLRVFEIEVDINQTRYSQLR